jgi:hypothetical protein
VRRKLKSANDNEARLRVWAFRLMVMLGSISAGGVWYLLRAAS